MAKSTPIRGAKIAFELGAPGENFWADTTSILIDNEEPDSDVVTFWDAAHEGENRQYFFTLSALQSTQEGSFWRYVWDNTGEVVPFTYAPHGNEEPTQDQPHFIGTCKVGPKPAIGGDAGGSNTYTFETRFDIITGPTLDTGA